MTALELQPDFFHEKMYKNGTQILTSIENDSAVSIYAYSNSIENGEKISVVVSAKNLSEDQILFDSSSLSVSADNIGTLKVYSYDELVAEQESDRNTRMFFAALSGALTSASTSYSSGYTTTTGNMYGSVSNGSDTTYGNVNYSETTYDSAAAQNAMNQVNRDTQRNVSNINNNADQNINELRNNVLKKTTLLNGQSHGGVVKFQAPSLQSGEYRIYDLVVRVGDDEHKFTLDQKIIQN